MDKLKKIGIIWGIIVVLIFGTLTFMGFTYKAKTKDYKELENKLVEAEKKYVDANFLYPEDKSELKTSAQELIDNNYLDSLKKDDSDCTGYVIVKQNNTVYEYKAYIKCDKYMTKGYKE